MPESSVDWPRMGLKHLVGEVAIRCSSRGIYINELAARCGWNLDEVLAFLRSEKLPSRQMLRDIGKELGVSAEEVERLLSRK